MDAANVDLKAFTEHFHKKITGSHLQSVLETLEYIKRETTVWLELTTLLIPGENDSEAEIQQMIQWVVEHLGPDLPMHFSVFHPDWKMLNTPSTPHETVIRTRHIALENGMRYAPVGNMHDKQGDNTWCHHCGALLISRGWYKLS
jgi:pyruvate formate lyase activating enzyme